MVWAAAVRESSPTVKISWAAAVGSLHVQMNVFLPEQINQGIGKSLGNGIGGIAVIVLTDADVVGSGVLLWKRII